MVPMIAMEVVGVRVEMPSNQPIVLLKEIDGQRFLPIWVGASEATAIAFAQQGVQPPRPLTHDLMTSLFELFEVELNLVELTEIKDGVFYSTIHFTNSELEHVSISSRPSDAIALAIRASSKIFASEELLNEIGLEIPEVEGENQEIEKFKEFLDQITPEDFLG